MADPFRDGRISIETRIEVNDERNLSDTQIMDRTGLDYFHPDGDGYTKGCSIRKTSVSAVILGIRAIQDIPNDILEQAVAVFHQTGFKEARKHRKIYIIFGCIYNAALSLDYPVILPDLAKQCDMTPGEITQAMSVFSKCGNKGLMVSTHMTPSMYVYPFCKGLNQEALTEDILHVVTEVLARAEELEDAQPTLVAAGAIYYYTSILDIGITKEEIAAVSGLTKSSIEKMSKDISYFHNDCED